MVGLRSAAWAAWLLAGVAFAPVAPPHRAATDIEIVWIRLRVQGAG
jgi:hypothetical protein